MESQESAIYENDDPFKLWIPSFILYFLQIFQPRSNFSLSFKNYWKQHDKTMYILKAE